MTARRYITRLLIFRNYPLGTISQLSLPMFFTPLAPEMARFVFWFFEFMKTMCFLGFYFKKKWNRIKLFDSFCYKNNFILFFQRLFYSLIQFFSSIFAINLQLLSVETPYWIFNSLWIITIWYVIIVPTTDKIISLENVKIFMADNATWSYLSWL
jgi:hypothetical protein